MTAYQAPIRDMLFAMREIGDLAHVATLPGNDEVSDELVDAILEEAAKFAEGVLAPINKQGDKERHDCKDGEVTAAPGFQGRLGSNMSNPAGWACVPRLDFGGQGLPKLVATPVMEMWKSANMSFSLCPLLTGGAIEALLLSGTDQLKQTFLPKMVAGDWTGTMNLTEPQAGSDLARAHTRHARGRSLPHHRPEDFHHLRRARPGGEHHPSGARAHARRARGRQGHFAVHRAQVPGQCRRQPGRAQRRALRLDRAQARHPRQPHRAS